MLGFFSINPIIDWLSELSKNSLYASSISTTVFLETSSQNLFNSSAFTMVAVGFAGLQIYTNCVSLLIAFIMAGRSCTFSFVSGTSITFVPIFFAVLGSTPKVISAVTIFPLLK
jgi:hypothetical protein